MNRLLGLAKNDLSNARDNLARARMAIKAGADPTKQWGQSGKTLAEIISGYEEWERESLETVNQLEARG